MYILLISVFNAISKKQEEEQMRQSIYDLWPCVWQLDFICNTALDPSIRESVAMKLLLGGFSQEVHDDQLILRSWQSAGFSHNNCLPIAAGCTMRACWGVKHVVARAQLEWTALEPLAIFTLKEQLTPTIP